MSRSEEWEWLDDLSDWEPPKELRGPVRYVARNLAIKMLSCEILGNDVIALLGKFIAEYSRFNIWFPREAKGSGRDARQLALLSNVPMEQTRLVYEAWHQFDAASRADAPDKEVRLEIGARREELAVALQNSTTALTNAME